MLRAFQMLTRCETIAMLHEKQSDKLVSLWMRLIRQILYLSARRVGLAVHQEETSW